MSGSGFNISMPDNSHVTALQYLTLACEDICTKGEDEAIVMAKCIRNNALLFKQGFCDEFAKKMLSYGVSFPFSYLFYEYTETPLRKKIFETISGDDTHLKKIVFSGGDGAGKYKVKGESTEKNFTKYNYGVSSSKNFLYLVENPAGKEFNKGSEPLAFSERGFAVLGKEIKTEKSGEQKTNLYTVHRAMVEKLTESTYFDEKKFKSLLVKEGMLIYELGLCDNSSSKFCKNQNANVYAMFVNSLKKNNVVKKVCWFGADNDSSNVIGVIYVAIVGRKENENAGFESIRYVMNGGYLENEMFSILNKSDGKGDGTNFSIKTYSDESSGNDYYVAALKAALNGDSTTIKELREISPKNFTGTDECNAIIQANSAINCGIYSNGNGGGGPMYGYDPNNDRALTLDEIDYSLGNGKRSKNVDTIAVHCAATRAGKNFTTMDINRWHTKERGWACIGYHFVIYLDGTIHAGREIKYGGANVADHNWHVIGICYIGGLDSNGNPADTRTPEQKATMLALINRLIKELPQITHVWGHRDFPGVAKACPCFDAKSEYKHP